MVSANAELAVDARPGTRLRSSNREQIVDDSDWMSSNLAMNETTEKEV
jgi:hypothetical protein